MLSTDDPTDPADELAVSRARVRQLEQQLLGLLGSPAWRLSQRLRTWRSHLASYGKIGRVLDLLLRAVGIWRHEGLRGVATRGRHRLRVALIGRGVPLPRGRISVPPMSDGGGISIVVVGGASTARMAEGLASIVEHSKPGTYELILVPRESIDATTRMLRRCDGVRALRAEGGESLAGAWNRGSAGARGEFLFFLDGDTSVLPGWQSSLLDILKSEATAGAAGGQILLPGDRLDAAGGIVWRDGRACPYGHGDDRHRPEYQHVRPVDYCPASGLLVRRELFERVGGFDPRYEGPAYLGIDLCFALRAAGHHTLYQPRARLVRLGGPGPAPALDEVLERDRAVFVDKHDGILATQPSPDPARTFRARDRRPGLRVLVLDHMVPLYDRDSGSVRMLALLRMLGELGHPVTFVPDNLTPLEPYTAALQRLGVEVIVGRVGVLDYLMTHRNDFDLMILCRVTIAAKYLHAVAALPARPPIVFDTVDLHFLREQREAALLDDPRRAEAAARTKATELALARAAEQVWVVSPYEASLLREEDPQLSVAVVPNIHSVRSSVPPFEGRRDLLFVGGFRHPPNEDAVRHFVGEILPLVRGRVPEARFVVVGADPPPAVQALASRDVVIAGHVPDLDPVFDRCRVFVAPLRYGAGLKGKVGQSLALGLPLVTTTIGAEGMALRDGEHALIADRPADFAARVVQLYTDAALWTRLSEAGRRHVEAELGYERVKRSVVEILRDLRAASRISAS